MGKLVSRCLWTMKGYYSTIYKDGRWGHVPICGYMWTIWTRKTGVKVEKVGEMEWRSNILVFQVEIPGKYE